MRSRSLVAFVVVGSVLAPAAAAARTVPGTHCRVFPSSNIWNTRVDGLPVHPMSDTWLGSAHASSTDLHPDFGPPSYGIPYDVVGRRHRKVEIAFEYADESDAGPYPFDDRTPIEGGSDRHALIVERGRCRLFELFGAEWNDGDPTAGSGAIFDLDSNRLRPETWTSADAAARSSRVSYDGMRFGPDGSATRSGSRSGARPRRTSGRPGTRRAWTTPTVRRWAHGSDSTRTSTSPGSARRRARSCER